MVGNFPTCARVLSSQKMQLMIDQATQDEAIQNLVQVLDDLFGFLQEAETLKKIKSMQGALDTDGVIASQKEILKLMLIQAAECAYFIQDYAKYRGPCMFSSTLSYLCLGIYELLISVARTMKNMMSEADTKTKEYAVKFNELKSAFQSHAILHTEITVIKVLTQVSNIGKRVIIDTAGSILNRLS